MLFRDYIKDLELQLNQTGLKKDMFFLIASFLNETIDKEKLNVSIRNTSEMEFDEDYNSKIFHGLGTFPDMVILDNDFKFGDTEDKKIKGVILVEQPQMLKELDTEFLRNSHLTPKQDIIERFCICFERVIYTDGLTYMFYERDPITADQEQEIREVQKLIYTFNDRFNAVQNCKNNVSKKTDDYLDKSLALIEDYDKMRYDNLKKDLDLTFSDKEVFHIGTLQENEEFKYQIRKNEVQWDQMIKFLKSLHD